MHPWWFRHPKDRAQDRVGKLEAEAKAVELQQAVECASFWTESMELQKGGIKVGERNFLKKIILPETSSTYVVDLWKMMVGFRVMSFFLNGLFAGFFVLLQVVLGRVAGLSRNFFKGEVESVKEVNM